MKYLFLLLLIAACSFSAPEPMRYQINPEAAIPLPPKTGDVLRVAVPKGAFGLESDHIQVQTADSHITGIENAAWVEPLNKMLQPILIRALANSGRFAGVVDDNSPAVPMLELQTSIERFTLVYPQNSKGSLHVEVALRAELVKLPEDTLVFSRRLEASEPVEEMRLPYIVSAFQRALAKCTGNLIATIP